MNVQCQDCGTHFLIDNSTVVDAVCPGCGGKRFERDQPSPLHSDGELRNMVDPYTGIDSGGNPLQEGILGDWQPHWRRDEQFSSVQSSDLIEPDFGSNYWFKFIHDQDLSQKQIDAFVEYTTMHNRADRDSGELQDIPAEEVDRLWKEWTKDGMPVGEFGERSDVPIDPVFDQGNKEFAEEINEHGEFRIDNRWFDGTDGDPLPEGAAFAKIAFDFDFSEDAPEATHKFIIDSGGQVYSEPEPTTHEAIAEKYDLIDRGYPHNLSLGELKNDNSTEWYQHDTPLSPKGLAATLQKHFDVPVTIDPNLKPTSFEERFGLPVNPLEQNRRRRLKNPQREREVDVLYGPAKQRFGPRQPPLGENEGLVRGGSVDTLHEKMSIYMPLGYKEATDDIAPGVERAHSAVVTPGSAGIHAGTTKWLSFLDANVNDLNSREQGSEIIRRHGMSQSPEFGQPVTVSVHHPEHLPAAIETIEQSANGSRPTPLMKEVGYGVVNGTHPVPPGIDPDTIRLGHKIAGPAAELLLPAARAILPRVLPSLMVGALRGPGNQSGELPPPPPPRTPQQLAKTADLQTPSSNPSVGEHDNPEEVDQKEFNDKSTDPNFHNPELSGDAGGSSTGEDPVYNQFREDSPAVERAELVLPLLLHYYQSEDSGHHEPFIRELHNLLEQENPGYLDRAEDDPQSVEELLKLLREPPKVTAAGYPMQQAPAGGFVQPATQPGQPGSPAVNPPGQGVQPGGGRCNACGGPTTADGTCTYCGSKVNPAGGATPANQLGPASLPPNPVVTKTAALPDRNQVYLEALENQLQRLFEEKGLDEEDINAIYEQMPESHTFGPSEEPHGGYDDPEEYHAVINEVGDRDILEKVHYLERVIRNLETDYAEPDPGHNMYDQYPQDIDDHLGKTAAPHQGPVTPEQRSAVAELLLEMGRQDEIPIMENEPWNYAKELAQVAQRLNVPPNVEDGGVGSPAPPEPAQEEAPPGATIPTPPQQFGASLTQKLAADNIAPRCPKCGSSTTAIANANGDCRCHSCGNTWEVDDLVPDNESPAKIAGGDMGWTQRQDELDKNDAYNAGDSYYGPKDHIGPDEYDPGADADVFSQCPICGGSGNFLGQLGNRDHYRCRNCGMDFSHEHGPRSEEPWNKEGWATDDGLFHGKVAAPPEHPDSGPNQNALPAADRPVPREVDQSRSEDSSHTWTDEEGNDLQIDQEYELHTPGFAIPDIVRVEKIRPGSIDVTTIGEYNNAGQPDIEYTYELTHEDLESRGITFRPSEGPQSEEVGNEDATQYLEEPSPPPRENTEPVRASANFDRCPKCSHRHIVEEWESPEVIRCECYRCAHTWRRRESDLGPIEAGAQDREWIKEDNEPLFGPEDNRFGFEYGSQSRNLEDIVKKTGGRRYTPREQQDLISEPGLARNMDLLELEDTHYKVREDFTGKANPYRVPDEHLALGVPG